MSRRMRDGRISASMARVSVRCEKKYPFSRSSTFVSTGSRSV